MPQKSKTTWRSVNFPCLLDHPDNRNNNDFFVNKRKLILISMNRWIELKEIKLIKIMIFQIIDKIGFNVKILIKSSDLVFFKKYDSFKLVKIIKGHELDITLYNLILILES